MLLVGKTGDAPATSVADQRQNVQPPPCLVIDVEDIARGDHGKVSRPDNRDILPALDKMAVFFAILDLLGQCRSNALKARRRTRLDPHDNGAFGEKSRPLGKAPPAQEARIEIGNLLRRGAMN